MGFMCFKQFVIFSFLNMSLRNGMVFDMVIDLDVNKFKEIEFKLINEFFNSKVLIVVNRLIY